MPKTKVAHVAQEEETLMMLRTTIQPVSSPTPTSTSTSDGKAAAGGWIQGPVASPAVAEPKERMLVHLHEQKVFMQFRAEKERDSKIWICDTGATDHMSGSRAAFADLDAVVCGTVQFSDDSVAQIEGCGSVLFVCKNREHRAFAGVYYIPRLTANIVSVGQLDEIGYDIHIKEGTMSIHEPGG
jgi:hypothetical protein